MVARKTIGIPVFLNSKENTGITNYVINILFALRKLEEKKQPIVLLFYTKNVQIDLSFFESSNYEKLKLVPLENVHPNNIIKRALNKLYRSFFKQNLFVNTTIFDDVDFFFPFWDFISELKSIPSHKRIHWLVDFNSYYFPEYYSSEMLKYDQNWKNRVVESGEKIVLSSYASKIEFEKIFHNAKNEIKILRFVSSPIFHKIEKKIILDKFLISENYFIVLNQFWPHKNHQVVIEALNLITKEYKDLKIVFTGNLSVNRKGKNEEQDYLCTLYNLIEKYNLNDKIIFTDFLDRNDQINLMNYASAIIQPSLYEGWNTSVEEGKSLNKIILLSEIEVHKEQMNQNCYLFNPYDFEKLSRLMLDVLIEKYPINILNYNRKNEEYALEIINLND